MVRRLATDLPTRAVLVLTTPHGSAEAEATERDARGNTRAAGRGGPPFRVELVDGDGECVPR